MQAVLQGFSLQPIVHTKHPTYTLKGMCEGTIVPRAHTPKRAQLAIKTTTHCRLTARAQRDSSLLRFEPVGR